MRYLTIGLLGLLFSAPVSTTAIADDNQLAPLFLRSERFLCDGTAYANAWALSYQQTGFVHSVYIALLEASPGQNGYVSVSKNNSQVNGPDASPNFAVLAGDSYWKRTEFIDYGNAGIPVNPGESVAVEWGCVGGGWRQFNVTIWWAVRP